MITDAILTIILNAVNSLLALIPSLSFDWSTSGGLGTLVTTANVFFPISEAFAIIRTVISWGATLAVVWAIYKIIDWLPIT